MKTLNMRPQLAFSIADLPLNVPIGELFLLARKLNLEGVEVLPGFKMSSIEQLIQLVYKYKVSITSVHQPMSIGKKLLPLDQTFSIAQYFKAPLVMHPLKKHSLFSVEQKTFFQKLSFLSKKYKVQVLIENLPPISSLPIYRFFSKADKSTTDILSLYRISKSLDFRLTLDTSHLQRDPHKINNFDQILSRTSNIHLSDFTSTKQHLALGNGKLDLIGLCQVLREFSYHGLITIEMSPRVFVNKKKYLTELESSIGLLRSKMGF